MGIIRARKRRPTATPTTQHATCRPRAKNTRYRQQQTELINELQTLHLQTPEPAPPLVQPIRNNNETTNDFGELSERQFSQEFQPLPQIPDILPCPNPVTAQPNPVISRNQEHHSMYYSPLEQRQNNGEQVTLTCTTFQTDTGKEYKD
ncbi:hypothetical protein GOODEAATRI_015972 [Goodea atripinnis]|uniref:Uncharacterized protein n=1 Tax=Goodea atripinnis TaxID=208336 RepID=A0ABV0PYD1_9TELE